jgi:hypothetical protein
VALKPRFRHKRVLSYTPYYSGWMKWHDYASLSSAALAKQFSRVGKIRQ